MSGPKTCHITLRITALIIGFSAVALGAVDADAATRTEVKRMVIEEARNSIVPPSLALAVAKVESDFQDRVRSHKGAQGVMQIMPATAHGEFGVNAEELWKPRLNIQLGIDYLERLHAQYGGSWELALSHYNGGTLRGGTGANAKPHGYTRKYVANVMRWWQRYEDQANVWGSAVVKARRVDAWIPARTKIAKIEIQGEADPKSNSDVEYPLKTKFNALQVGSKVLSAEPVSKATVHWQAPRAKARVMLEPSANIKGGFWDRVSRARRTLDDFGLRTRWVRG
jgi:hypothetical protein